MEITVLSFFLLGHLERSKYLPVPDAADKVGMALNSVSD